MMAALSIEGPVVQYTGPTFCYVVQAIPTVALMANYTMGPGDELKTTLDFILGIALAKKLELDKIQTR